MVFIEEFFGNVGTEFDGNSAFAGVFAVVGGRVGPEDVAHGAGLGDFASTLDFLDLLEGDAVVGEEAAVQDQDLREL